MSNEMENEISLKGIVENVVYRQGSSGWAVIDISTQDELVTVVGTMPDVNVGESIAVTGRWTNHKTFGRQFSASSCERTLPSTASAILKYLSSGAIKGIGPVTASKIVSRFAEKSLFIIEKEPHKLCSIKGISMSKAVKMSDEFKKQFGVREVMMLLSQYGISPSTALKAYKMFGQEAVEKIKECPYILCEEGINAPFELADKMAESMGKSYDDPNRIKAGVVYVLRHNLINGHTCLPYQKVVETTARFLGVEVEAVKETTLQLVQQETIVMSQLQGEDFLFLPTLYNAEYYCANRLKLMSQLSPPCNANENIEKEINLYEKMSGLVYEKLQRKAVQLALSGNLLVLTGGPGTGKTTALKAIIALLESKGQKVLVAAPTGRAAKRISEITGKEAKTIHRLLEVEWTDDEVQHFTRNEKNPLDCDVLIVDEFSMVDIILFEGLLRALPIKSKLIMVGDADQLPPVGPGNVLNDLILSQKLPVVQLVEVFRQALESLIVESAHKILHGQMPDITKKDKDFFFISLDNAPDLQRLITDLCSRRLPQNYNLSPFGDIQVLCPTRKGELGTVQLNKILQNVLNPPSPKKREIKINTFLLREGDKVMQVKNNYDISFTRDDGGMGTGIFNGDVGVLEKIDKGAGVLFVRFDDRLAHYTIEDAADLELAYAITVHKSQGSEFEAVIMPIFPGPPKLYYRNLLYTGVTRARSLLILAGIQKTLQQMVDNNRKSRRYSALCSFLQSEE